MAFNTETISIRNIGILLFIFILITYSIDFTTFKIFMGWLGEGAMAFIGGLAAVRD